MVQALPATKANVPVISVICPTIARTSLEKISRQVVAQLLEGDQYIVVGDGFSEASQTLINALGSPQAVYLNTDPTGHYGAEQVDLGITHATGDYILLVGDDDEIFMDALRTIRSIASTDDPHPYLFGMMYQGKVMAESFNLCQCSGQQFVFPNQPDKIARYSDHIGHANDWEWMHSTVNLWEGRIELRPELIATLHRRNEGRVW